MGLQQPPFGKICYRKQPRYRSDDDDDDDDDDTKDNKISIIKNNTDKGNMHCRPRR